jgi:hypothetical protein
MVIGLYAIPIHADEPALTAFKLLSKSADHPNYQLALALFPDGCGAKEGGK